MLMRNFHSYQILVYTPTINSLYIYIYILLLITQSYSSR